MRPGPVFAALAWPSTCSVCAGWGAGAVCRACLRRYAAPVPRCERCALEVPAGATLCGACLREPPPQARSVAAVGYAYPWDALIAAFKFHAALHLAPPLAAQLARAVREARTPPPDLVLPVPLAAARLRERGYNQAWELARRVARALSCRAEPAWLLRIRETPQQLALPPARRAANVRGAFLVEPRRVPELQGRDVALIDDVMTSGATLAEAARCVLAAGACSVQAWVVARTPRD